MVISNIGSVLERFNYVNVKKEYLVIGSWLEVIVSQLQY